MTKTYPHEDISGRGLDDGECKHCGDSGSLENGECAVRLRAALDAARADLQSAAMSALCWELGTRTTNALDMAEPIANHDGKPCPVCGAPRRWGLPNAGGSVGRLTCTRGRSAHVPGEPCGWRGPVIARLWDGDVVVLPTVQETASERAGRDARKLREEVSELRRRVQAALAICNDPSPVTRSPSLGALHDEGLASGGDLVRSVVRDALEGRHG